MSENLKFVDGKNILSIRTDSLEQSETGSVSAEQVPGVLLFGDQPLYQIGNHLFPVLGCVCKDGKFLPVINFPIMDEKPTTAEPEEVAE